MQILSERQVEDSIMNWEQVPFPVLSEAQFIRWQSLLEERTGMYIPYERKSMLQSNLKIRMRELECGDFDQYYQLVSAKPSGIVEWNVLLDRLMVQETRFYRNSESLALCQDFLATLLLENARESTKKRSISIWSVGCCTGEEPYTLAILANEVFLKQGQDPLFGITANDISLPALSRARDGIYNTRKLLDLPQDLVLRYFEQQNTGLFQIRDDIKRRVCFSMANIVDIGKSPLRNMDVIYCQNVLIYFRKERKHTILDCLVERLAPGGMLVIGQGEATEWRHSEVYRVTNNQTLAFIRRKDNSHKTTH